MLFFFVRSSVPSVCVCKRNICACVCSTWSVVPPVRQRGRACVCWYGKYACECARFSATRFACSYKNRILFLCGNFNQFGFVLLRGCAFAHFILLPCTHTRTWLKHQKIARPGVLIECVRVRNEEIKVRAWHKS